MGPRQGSSGRAISASALCIFIYVIVSYLLFGSVWHVLTALHGQSELDTKVAKGHN